MTAPPGLRDDLADLLARVARQDKAAFGDLYKATSAKLYGVILRISRRPAVAQELLQEVYIRIWQRAGDFDRRRASPITWLATIARNRALDEVRLKAAVSVEDAPEALDVPDPGRSPAEWAELADETRRLEDCLAGLETDKRDIIRLAYAAGLSREELSERYGRPVATIKTWLHRGLKQLKDCLGS